MDSIVYICYKIDNKKLNFENIECEKLSNGKIQMVIDGKIIRRKNPFRVTYKCFGCEALNTVNLNNFVSKLSKDNGLKSCRICSQQFSGKNIIEESDRKFSCMSNEYKSNYFKVYLSREEFELYRNRIVSIQRDKFSDLTGFEYYPHIQLNNQKYFLPYLMNTKQEVFELPKHVKFKCDGCGCDYGYVDLETFKNKLKLLCKDCVTVTKPLKICIYKNCEGEKVIYHTNFELKFIKFCNTNSIRVVNCSKGFELPDKNIVVKIVSNKDSSKSCDGVTIINPKNYMKTIKSLNKI